MSPFRTIGEGIAPSLDADTLWPDDCVAWDDPVANGGLFEAVPPGFAVQTLGDNGLVIPDVYDLDGDGNTLEPTPMDLDGQPRFVDVPRLPDTGAGTPPIMDLGAYEGS